MSNAKTPFELRDERYGISKANERRAREGRKTNKKLRGSGTSNN